MVANLGATGGSHRVKILGIKHLAMAVSDCDAALARSHWRKAVDLYETARTRPQDDRYQEIKQKLKLLEPEKQP